MNSLVSCYHDDARGARSGVGSDEEEVRRPTFITLSVGTLYVDMCYRALA